MEDTTNDSSEVDSLTLFTAGVSKYGDLLRAASGDLSPAPVPPTSEEQRQADEARIAYAKATMPCEVNKFTRQAPITLKPLKLSPGISSVAGVGLQPTMGPNTFIPTGPNKAAEQAHAFSMIGVDPADLGG